NRSATEGSGSRLYEGSTNGTNYLELRAPTSLSASNFTTNFLVQRVITTRSSSAPLVTATIIIPDTSIPQITEGVGLMFVNITPKFAESTLHIYASIPYIFSQNTWAGVFAVFDDPNV